MADARQPYRAYFGGATIERLTPNGLDVSGSAFEVYDQNLLADFTSPDTSGGVGVGGFYTNLLGDVSFVRRAAPIQISATGGLNARYYPGLGKFVAADYHGGFGASRASPRTTVRLDQSLSYSPVFLLGLFADALPAALGAAQRPSTEYALSDDRSIATATAADVSRRLSDRTQMIFSGGYRRVHYLAADVRRSDLSVFDAGGSIRQRLTEESDVRLGYSYRRARYDGAEVYGFLIEQPDEHNFQAGGAVRPPLPFSRRTVITAEGGMAFVNAPVSSNVFETRRQLRLVADAGVAHRFAATWLIAGSFRRGTGFVEGLNGPVFTDAVSAATSGFFNNRTDLAASFAYSTGEPWLVGAETSFTSMTTNARVRYALSAHWALAGEYSFYFYDFTNTARLTAGIVPRVKRNSVRAGLTLWLPISRP